MPSPRPENSALSQATAQLARLVAAFLNTLNPEQRRRALIPFDSEARCHWSYLPRHRLVTTLFNAVGALKQLGRSLSPAEGGERPRETRGMDLQGLAYREMTPTQRAAAEALLRFGLSEVGYQKAQYIRQLEDVLRQIERLPGRFVRDPEQYAFTVFGDPRGYPWTWRLEGHHLVLYFTVAADGLIAVTPTFFGANPAEVPVGHHLQGLRTLAREQDLGFQLLHSLTAEQRGQAILAAQAPADILTDPRRGETLRETVGLPLHRMSDAQRELAVTLIQEYARNLRDEFAQAQLRRLREAGLDAIHFTWAGALEPGQGHYYRLHGPALLIEYDNTQNNANHIHTVWRDPSNDYGTDYLRAHYANSRPGHGHTHGAGCG
jgi:hypothetical protein